MARIGAAFSPAEQDRARAAAAPPLAGRAGRGPVRVGGHDRGNGCGPARRPRPAARRAAAGRRAGLLHQRPAGRGADGWFEQALAYATEKLHGAAALAPAGTGMGQIAGYIVADYLIQHANRERRTARMPASTCDALRSHIGDPADAARLGDSAEGRLLYCYAIPLYRHTADAGDGDAAQRLAGLLAERGDLDELSARADASDVSAAFELAGLLAEHGNLDEAMQILPRRGRRARERPAASQAADATGPPRRSGATAPVRPEPGRVNCQRVKASCLSPHDARTARRIPEAA